MKAVSTFDVTGWDPATYSAPGAIPLLSQATVTKTFSGDLEGESTAQLLMCQADAKDLSAGAGYVASDSVTGTLGGKSGSFVMQHGGLSASGNSRTWGHIVPGSGAGELAGITGDVTIDVDADGKHTIVLEYDFPD